MNYTIQWQRRRSDFNHNWLKNKFLNKLQAGINLLEGKVEDPQLEENLASDLFRQWEEHKNLAETLINDFQESMSPKTIMHHYPLINMDQSSKIWLSNLVHILWLQKGQILTLEQNVRSSLLQANEIYNELNIVMKNKAMNYTSFVQMKKHLPLFLSWRDACYSLSKTISQLPDKIEIK